MEDKKDKEDILVVKYNKFIGEFEFEEGMKQSDLTKEAMIHVTKLNSILFGLNNSENSHSISIILSTYWLPFLTMFLIFVLIIAYLSIYQLAIETI